MTVMTNQTETNMAIEAAAMARMAEGDGSAWVEAMADDIAWRQMGSAHFAKAYEGKEVLLGQLFRPLMKQYAGRYTNTPVNIFADGDTVIVEARGAVITKAGLPYNNCYCMVMQMRDGKIAEVREYLDTALANVCLDATHL